jgi:hypothetical protein
MLSARVRLPGLNHGHAAARVRSACLGEVSDHITTKKAKKGLHEVIWPETELTLYSAGATQPELRHTPDVTFHGMSAESLT